MTEVTARISALESHEDIPDEVVTAAQLFDHAHWREDRHGQRGGSWGSVPPDQVRRLIWGALCADAEARKAAIEEMMTSLIASYAGKRHIVPLSEGGKQDAANLRDSAP